MTIWLALGLVMLAGALFGGAYEVSRGSFSEGQRAFPGAFRPHPGLRGAGSAAAAPAPRIGVGEDRSVEALGRSLPLMFSGEGRGHGLHLLRRPSPVPSYAAGLQALRRVHQSVTGPIVPRAR